MNYIYPENRAVSVTMLVSLDEVRSIRRFRQIDAAAAEWLAPRLMLKTFDRDDVLFYEGDESRHLYIIRDGSIKVVRTLSNGRELIVGIFRQNDAVGEAALIDGVGYPATAVGQDPGAVWVLPRNDYLAWIERFPSGAMAVIRDMTLHMRALRQRVEDLGGGGVDYRLARVLCTLCARFGSDDGDGIRIDARLTRQDLADLVGARIETVIRSLSKWQRKGLIAPRQDALVVADLEYLQRIAAHEAD